MNRKITFLAIVILSVLALCVPAMAAAQPGTISEDFKEVYYQGETYVMLNTGSQMSVNVDWSQKLTIQLTQAQKQEVSEVTATAGKNVVIVHFRFENGANEYVSYLNSKQIATYENMEKGVAEYYELVAENDTFPTDPIKVSPEKLLANPVSVKGISLAQYTLYPVEGYSLDEELSCTMGYLIYCDKDTVYYLSCYGFEEGYVTEPNLMLYDTVTVYQITDAELLKQLCETEESDEVSEMSDTAEYIIVGILSVMFIVIPAVIGIVFMVLSFKATQPYKKYFKAISALLWCSAIVPAVLLIITIASGHIVG